MTDSLTIWRVIDSSGGIFHEDKLDCFIAKYVDRELYPCPHNDNLIRRFPIEEDELCGCENLDQLQHWFGDSEVVEHLSNWPDVMIHKLKVPAVDTVIGERQVLFNRHRAELVAAAHISKLPDILAGTLTL